MMEVTFDVPNRFADEGLQVRGGLLLMLRTGVRAGFGKTLPPVLEEELFELLIDDRDGLLNLEDKPEDGRPKTEFLRLRPELLERFS